MFVDVIKFVCSSAELVRMMRGLEFRRFLQRLISGGCQFYVLVANMNRITLRL